MTKSTVGQTLDWFRAQLGVGEDPLESNCQKFSRYWGKPCEAWCADDLAAGLKQNGVLDVPYSAAARFLADGYKKAGRWHNGTAGLRPGDVLFFTWEGDTEVHHTSIVEVVRSDGSIVDLGGNVGGEGGDKHRRTVRRAHITGYGRPVYATTSAPTHDKPTTKPTPAGPVPRAHLTVDGDRGPLTVKALQRALNGRLSGADLVVDGDEGIKTVTAEQRYLNVRQDGDRGPLTIKAEQRHIGARVDGADGPDTTRHLQRALNEGRY